MEPLLRVHPQAGPVVEMRVWTSRGAILMLHIEHLRRRRQSKPAGRTELLIMCSSAASHSETMLKRPMHRTTRAAVKIQTLRQIQPGNGNRPVHLLGERENEPRTRSEEKTHPQSCLSTSFVLQRFRCRSLACVQPQM